MKGAQCTDWVVTYPWHQKWSDLCCLGEYTSFSSTLMILARPTNRLGPWLESISGATVFKIQKTLWYFSYMQCKQEEYWRHLTKCQQCQNLVVSLAREGYVLLACMNKSDFTYSWWNYDHYCTFLFLQCFLILVDKRNPLSQWKCSKIHLILSKWIGTQQIPVND